MNVMERHKFVVGLLMQQNRATVAELAQATGASEMTIRRDLEVLESRGALRRVRGGAVSSLPGGVEPPYAIRAMSGAQAKERLARAVVELLTDGETVALDTGTTAVAIAKAMADRQLTVAPLSLHAAFTLSAFPGIQLVMPGGQVRPEELSFYGHAPVQTFKDLCFDTFILGCCGVDPVQGATAYNLDDVQVKRAAVASAQRVILVATADKIGRAALGRICSMEEIALVVTDAPADSPAIEVLRDQGVEVVHPADG
ncbi:DeoR family transcriptional regulator [Streptomyces nojiriensis]|uniref:Lactose phosphotransferase system repressor n=1 Tax=Streptomyces nojiriensis TaxID=66374 RepID=A0ABQ3SHG9_9ACTN|nr:DeoR/GlpR family DNA-binding transcription regulator [Streptomyces nojiriensis]QTI49215.1 Glucitol operon repressor [Streptomyces nojiriensis]GGS10534.1 DeoR family transcriptional regulator [Streptomyces nojiriensis]GHI67589.1 DeoR family transcriptional regulator [Streptomyces nojiriensis]